MAQVWSGGERGEESARFTWNISCQRGKRGGHSPPPSLPPTYPAACPAPVGSAAAAGGRQRGRCPIESPMTFNFERGASSSPSSSCPPPFLSFLYQLSFRSFIFPPAAVAAHHDLRRSPDRGRVGVVVGVEEREEALLSIEPRCPPIFLCRKYLLHFPPRSQISPTPHPALTVRYLVVASRRSHMVLLTVAPNSNRTEDSIHNTASHDGHNSDSSGSAKGVRMNSLNSELG